MRLAWTSDLHLNHAALPAWESWIDSLLQARPDAILICGDISEAEDVEFQLRRMAEELKLPLFFVLGNHDFYASSIATTRQTISALARDLPSLVYLTDQQPISIGEQCYLVGEDGWGDGTQGDYENSYVRLNDFQSIEDFRCLDSSQWQNLMIQLGEASAERLTSKLHQLSDNAREIIVATHVPPFREACWYEGKTTDDHWAPFFVCGQVGEALRQFAENRPGLKVHVLCGHTHHAGEAEILPNLHVSTASAEYGSPKLERVICVPS